ncbi:heavy-metal-associated domain-containing protein [Imbroritus primus]|jgi:copper chaperone|uniref:Heavy-metal-associated domain-containing protein n=1 Tax=Imbroritus primus TaxID=3058603 RepID=A0ACD3SP11_9BURK|nr:heavy-metal-associated domain-containing protein [Burkholderiaceae bacterium PBA]
MIEFKVEGMSCNHCVQAITRAVRERDPVASVTVDLPTKTVNVGSTAEVAELRQAIEAEGYTVTSVSQS